MIDGRKRLIVLCIFLPKTRNGGCERIRQFRIVGREQDSLFSLMSLLSKSEDTSLVSALYIYVHFLIELGSSVLHWDRSKENLPSVILTADSIMSLIGGGISVMWSYPNFIGLPPDDMLEIWKAVKNLDFEWIYGGWYTTPVIKNGKPVILKSLQQITRIMTKSTSHEIFQEKI